MYPLKNPSKIAVPEVKQPQTDIAENHLWFLFTSVFGPMLMFFNCTIMMIIIFWVRYTSALQISITLKDSIAETVTIIGRKMCGETFAAIMSPGLLDSL